MNEVFFSLFLCVRKVIDVRLLSCVVVKVDEKERNDNNKINSTMGGKNDDDDDDDTYCVCKKKNRVKKRVSRC